jgi:hypothetical protein
LAEHRRVHAVWHEARRWNVPVRGIPTGTVLSSVTDPLSVGAETGRRGRPTSSSDSTASRSLRVDGSLVLEAADRDDVEIVDLERLSNGD